MTNLIEITVQNAAIEMLQELGYNHIEGNSAEAITDHLKSVYEEFC